MSFRRWMRLAVATATALSALPASACLPPQPFPQFPGEREDAYAERNRLGTAAEDAEGVRLTQERSFDAARAVFLGRVENRRTISVDGRDGGEVTIRPLGEIKGALPRHMITLRDTMATDCGMLGAGDAPSQPAGSWVFVFDGMGEGEERRSEGFAAMQARDLRLLKAFRDFGSAHPATPPRPPGRK